ncbi:MAG: YbaN family protein, partial [Pseudomonadota bacterium]
MTRLIWTSAGWIAFGLGALGVALPLLPTVPFMLLAAFCFARGSDRFHDWLVEHPRFGPPIQDWRSSGVIRPRAKRLAVVAIAFSFVLSLAIGV